MEIARACGKPPQQIAVIHQPACDQVHDLAFALDHAVHRQQLRSEQGAALRFVRREERSFVGQHFWARGYFVSTVGRDEALIREYIKHQEEEDMRLDQMRLWS